MWVPTCVRACVCASAYRIRGTDSYKIVIISPRTKRQYFTRLDQSDSVYKSDCINAHALLNVSRARAAHSPPRARARVISLCHVTAAG